MRKKLIRLSCLVSAAGLSAGSLLTMMCFQPWAHAQQPASGTQLTAIWMAAGSRQELKSWSTSEFSKFQKAVGKEKDPQTGKVVKWEGVLISRLLDQILEKLPIESRAQIDLVVLRSRSGKSAFIPRALVSRYPLMLALGGSTVRKWGGEEGAIHSVVPWTSKPRILNEDLPLESYYISDVTQVELTNYRDRFSTFFLKRRTDPSAIRGEKLFVQNCVSCHMMEQPSTKSSLAILMERMDGEEAAKKLKFQHHPAGSYSAKLSDRDRRSIVRYLEAHRLENPASSSKITQSAQVQVN